MFDKRKHVCLSCGEVFHEDMERCRCCGGLCVLGSDEGENVLVLMSPDDTKLKCEIVKAFVDCRYEDVVSLSKKISVDDAEVLTALGNCYLHGDGGLAQDYALALDCYGRAVNCGGAEAAFRLFQMFDAGIGCPKKWNVARLMLLLANSRGWPAAKQEYQECEKVYRYAIGTPPPPPPPPPPPEPPTSSQVTATASVPVQSEMDSTAGQETGQSIGNHLPQDKTSPEYQMRPKAFLFDGVVVRQTKDWNDFFIAICEKLNAMDPAKFQTLPTTAKMGIAFKLKRNAGKVDFRQTNLGANHDVCVSKYAGASDLIAGHDGKTTLGRRMLELFNVDSKRITFTT